MIIGVRLGLICIVRRMAPTLSLSSLAAAVGRARERRSSATGGSIRSRPLRSPSGTGAFAETSSRGSFACSTSRRVSPKSFEASAEGRRGVRGSSRRRPVISGASSGWRSGAPVSSDRASRAAGSCGFPSPSRSGAVSLGIRSVRFSASSIADRAAAAGSCALLGLAITRLAGNRPSQRRSAARSQNTDY